ncbi:MAG: D-glycerate dehydrogenase [Pricia sp.]|nr:D-glycerate dehydrogenase [Pricia sp.]
MKVLVPLNIPDIGIEQMKKAGLHVTKYTEDLPMTTKELNETIKRFDALLSTSNYAIDAKFLNENRHLKIISQFAVGYDNIDIAEATRLGIPIANAPNAMTDATADIAFGLLLAVSRKMFHWHKTIDQGEWKHFRPQANLGIELKNKTVGIFGLGRIGLEFAKRCKGAYDMKILYCNRTANVEAENLLGASKVSFDELLNQCDIISAHCALTEDTKNKFNQQAFNAMKSSAIFINSSRGQVHNETDLINAIKNKEIWGAGLDVTNPEPMKPGNPLLSMENVAITPHIGSATVEARNRMSVYAAKNIIAFYKGEKIPYQVNRI